MCSGSEAGSDLRLIDFVYHSTLGLRVINKKRSLVGGQVLGFSRVSKWYAQYRRATAREGNNLFETTCLKGFKY